MGLERIGVGRTAEVFALEDGRVVKLFYPGLPQAVADAEAERARLADALGLPAPRFYGKMNLNGRTGLLYARAPGESLMARLLRAPDEESVADCLRLMARTHREILRVPLAGGGSLHAWLDACIARSRALTPDQRARALRLLDEVPDGAQACHGDYHPDNVMVDGDEVLVLDWANLLAGNPLLDIARTAFLLRFSSLPPGLSPQEQVQAAALRRRVADAYLRAMGVEQGEIEGAMTVCLAARTGEVPEAAEALMPVIEGRL